MVYCCETLDSIWCYVLTVESYRIFQSPTWYTVVRSNQIKIPWFSTQPDKILDYIYYYKYCTELKGKLKSQMKNMINFIKIKSMQENVPS